MSSSYTDAFDYGVIEGKRYFMPIRTMVMSIITTKSTLDKNNIKIDYQNWTWNDLAEIADKFGSDKTKSSEYLFNFEFDFTDILDSFGKSFIDMHTKKSYFNSPELKEVLKIYKKLSLFAAPYSDNEVITNPIKGFKSNYYAAFIDWGLILNSYSFISKNNDFQKDLGEEMIPIPLPSWYGNGYEHVDPCYLMGINSHCKNKEAAFGYIKFLLSDDMQGIKSIKNTHFLFNLGCPVNKKAFSSDLDFMKSDEVKDLFLQNFAPLSNDQIFRFAYIFNHIGKPINYDRQVVAIIAKASRDYLTGKKTEDQVLSEIDNKVELFLNE